MVMGTECGTRRKREHAGKCCRACHDKSNNQPDPPDGSYLLQEREYFGHKIYSAFAAATAASTVIPKCL